MAPPIVRREQRLFNEVRAKFCCLEKQTFMDTIELGRCFGLWVSFALILNQPRLQSVLVQGAGFGDVLVLVRSACLTKLAERKV